MIGVTFPHNVLENVVQQRPTWKTERNFRGKGFKTYSTLSEITFHPLLYVFSDQLKISPNPMKDKIYEIIKDIDITYSVKAKNSS